MTCSARFRTRKSGWSPELEGVLAQQPVTERVEGGNLDVRVPVGHEVSTRSSISAAALSVKVSARISSGRAFFWQ